MTYCGARYHGDGSKSGCWYWIGRGIGRDSGHRGCQLGGLNECTPDADRWTEEDEGLPATADWKATPIEFNAETNTNPTHHTDVKCCALAARMILVNDRMHTYCMICKHLCKRYYKWVSSMLFIGKSYYLQEDCRQLRLVRTLATAKPYWDFQ